MSVVSNLGAAEVVLDEVKPTVSSLSVVADEHLNEAHASLLFST